MNVHKSSLLGIFDSKQRLEVPLFQRQYVWNEENQWTPLWEDIERKFTEALEGRSDAPTHFLGAMVLDQKQTPTGHVVVRQIIDGQQRLTTLQIFLAAFRDFCGEQGCSQLADECGKFLRNTGMMADAQIDQYKVWPTQLDRPQFMDVISAGSRAEVLKRYPLRKRPYARKPDPRPRMVEAYLFFFEQLKCFFLGDEGSAPIAASYSLAERADHCFQSLRSALMVVVIDLDKDDDPQVIFETLNARGEPLLPADLLRNYIFFRAKRDKMDVEAAYQQYWQGFDDEFWRKEVKQGRLLRPRSDLFMQHFLASRQGEDIPIKHLYVEYRHWIETKSPFHSVAEELSTLARQRDHFRRIVSPEVGDSLFEFCNFLELYDIRTAYPLLLAIMDAGIPAEEWKEISGVLESYLLRRAVCDLTTKNYNRIFLTLTRKTRNDGISASAIRGTLLEQSGESAAWPDDAKFREAWLTRPTYWTLSSGKLVHLFTRLNQTFVSSKSESIVFATPPTIEHIMPQTWIENWPLADGSQGLDDSEVAEAPDFDARVVATRNRNAAIQTIGNLTILSQGLNSAQSNLPWDQKRPELLTHSLLPINQNLAMHSLWDEAVIEARGKELFDRAVQIWKR